MKKVKGIYAEDIGKIEYINKVKKIYTGKGDNKVKWYRIECSCYTDWDGTIRDAVFDINEKYIKQIVYYG
jgi:hypothetical protein